MLWSPVGCLAGCCPGIKLNLSNDKLWAPPLTFPSRVASQCQSNGQLLRTEHNNCLPNVRQLGVTAVSYRYPGCPGGGTGAMATKRSTWQQENGVCSSRNPKMVTHLLSLGEYQKLMAF